MGYSCELQPPEALYASGPAGQDWTPDVGEVSQARPALGPQWGAGRRHTGLQSEVLLCSRGGQDQMLWALSCPIE